MEEAYDELYQQFLRLRSLCLRQAALLHQLTAALRKQKGGDVPNGELSDMVSVPVQCTHENAARQPQALAAQSPAAPRGVNNRPSRNVGMFSDLLSEDMSKLCVDGGKESQEFTQNVAPLLSLDPSRWPGPSKNLLQPDHPAGDRTMFQMPATDSPSLVGDGFMMSDVALQSHICEFCQAVFPGDSTTRGEFLRHLYTHVT